jgi:site-specific recombinase XerC
MRHARSKNRPPRGVRRRAARGTETCGGRDFADRRDTELLTKLIDTGARLGELAGLHVDDLCGDVGGALVLGKGRR